jgi:type IV pilus assembly protein PilE
MRRSPKRKSKGHTFIEVLVASSLLATVTVMTIPGVAGIVHANRRTDGQLLLLTAAKRQKEHLIYHYSFAANPGDLGYAMPYSPEGHYRLDVVRGDQGRYVMRAVPTHSQAADYNCGYLQIDDRGRRSSEHGGENCWR